MIFLRAMMYRRSSLTGQGKRITSLTENHNGVRKLWTSKDNIY